MKIIHNGIVGFNWAIAVAIFLLAFSNIAFAAKPCVTGIGALQQINVDVPEDGSPDFANNACPKNPEKGNVCNSLNVKPDFKFRLTGPDAEKWKFVRIELGENANAWPGTLPIGVYSDFEFDSDEGLLTGRPTVNLIADDRQMKVQNNNCHNFTVHYRLVLINSDGEYIRLHPVIENEGTD